MSVLFIKNGLVPVGAEQYVRHPVRRSAHLHTDSFQVNIRVAFDKQFYNRNWNRITIDSFIDLKIQDLKIHFTNSLYVYDLILG